LEEERRLCYVGMTRAEQQLYLCAAEHRRLYGRDSYAPVSRFVKELPKSSLMEIRPKTQVSRPLSTASTTDFEFSQENDHGFHVGQRVMHPKFGMGTLTNSEGNGQHARVQVNFENAGQKWLVLSYANLQPA